MKGIAFLHILLCLWSVIICAQNNNCSNLPYRGKAYAPLFIPTDTDSILTIRVNLIFIQRDDGTGNFQENDAEQQAFLDDVMTILNDKVAHLVMPGTDCFTGAASYFVDDIKIQFDDHRYYVPKGSVWDNGLHTSNRYRLHPDIHPWYLDNVDDSLNSIIPDTLKGINIYFTEDSVIYNRYWEIQDTTDLTNYWTGDSEKGCSELPYHQNWNASSRIHMPCRYARFWWMKHIVPQLASVGNPQWYYEGWLMFAGALAGDLAHELGHSFNLLHPNDYYEWNNRYFSYPDTGCIASIMQPHASISTRDFLPPQEIGLMYFSTMTTNLQQFIPQDIYLGAKTLDTTISLPRMRMYYSLSIGSNGNVTMPCDMTFSTQGDIQVNNGGILSIDNASLQSAQNEWGGIMVQSGGQLFLSNVTIRDYNIIVKSGGSIVVNNNLVITGDHSITIEDGGNLCIDTDATIELTDEFSTIVVSPNANLGCPSCGENCILYRSALVNSGEGHFITYEGTTYIQNTTITSDSLVTGNTVYAGYDVTTTQAVGNVVVEHGGNLRIRANEAIFTKDVEVKLGGTLLIDK